MKNKELYVDPIPLSRLRKVVNQMKLYSDETPISFEYIMTAFFPSVWENVKNYGKDCYTEGYAQGLKEGKENEDKGIN